MIRVVAGKGGPEGAVPIELAAAVRQPFNVEPVVAADVAADRHQVNAMLFRKGDEDVPVLHAVGLQPGPGVEDAIDADGLPEAVEAQVGHDAEAAIAVGGIEMIEERALSGMFVVEDVAANRGDESARSFQFEVPAVLGDSDLFHSNLSSSDVD